MKLRTIAEADLPMIMDWRQEYPESLRTCFELTYAMQYDWFVNIVNNRQANARYWMILDDDVENSFKFPDGTGGFKDDVEIAPGKPIGYGNISNIQWENRHAEIGLLIEQGHLGEGKGIGGVKLLLEQAFCFMNLENIWGECYHCNSIGLDFWKKVSYISTQVDLPARKYYNGEYWPSLYFGISREDWMKALDK